MMTESVLTLFWLLGYTVMDNVTHETKKDTLTLSC